MVTKGFEKSTSGKQERFRTEIDLLASVFSEEIAKGDYYDIVYSPGEGVEVHKNGNLKAKISDPEFKQALWGIWLGNDPVDKNLKEKMLGL